MNGALLLPNSACLRTPNITVIACLRRRCQSACYGIGAMQTCAIEHFAIDPRCRGQQLGSRALTAFLSQPGKVVLEIDPPTTDIARRRQRFYTRLGFCHCPQSHTHPAYHTQFAPHPLVLMAAPAPLTPGEFVRFQHFLRETVMADCPVD